MNFRFSLVIAFFGYLTVDTNGAQNEAQLYKDCLRQCIENYRETISNNKIFDNNVTSEKLEKIAEKGGKDARDCVESCKKKRPN